MALPVWTFVLTDRAGTPYGEILNANERNVVLPLNRVPTASFRVPIWHPMADTILNNETLVKVYRQDSVTQTRRLVFHGPVITVQETGDALSPSIGVNAVGPFWRLSKRFVGMNKGAGFARGTATDVNGAVVMEDKADIAAAIVTTVNGQEYTGISNASYSPCGTLASYGPIWGKNAAEAIAEISASLNSFDYEVIPVEPSSAGGGGANFPQIGLFKPSALIGQPRPDAVFEFGTTRANVATYERMLSRENLMTKGWIPLPGWPDGVTADQDIISEEDSTARVARGLFEDVVTDAGIIDDALRRSVVKEHLKYRANPRHTATFTPAVNAKPEPLVDYEVGDWVRCRAVVRDTIRFDAMFRIWGVTFSLDQNGNESLNLQLVQE